MDWFLLIAVIPLIHMICVLLRSVRLKAILGTVDLPIPLWWLSLNHLKGTFFKSFLPGGIGGDIYRAYTITKKTECGPESVFSIMMEKVIGIASLLLVCVASLAYGTYWIVHPVFNDLAGRVLSACVAFVGLIIIAAFLMRAGLGARNPLAPTSWGDLKRINEKMFCFQSNGVTLLTIVILSLLLQIAVVSWYFAISRSMEIHLSFWVFMLTIPLVELLLMLPISIGGIGVRETAFVILLRPFGLTIADAISFSLLTFVVTTITRIVSGTPFLWEHFAKQR